MRENAQILADRAAADAAEIAQDGMPNRRTLVIVVIEENDTIWSSYEARAGRGLHQLTEDERLMLGSEMLVEMKDFVHSKPPPANDDCYWS